MLNNRQAVAWYRERWDALYHIARPVGARCLRGRGRPQYRATVY